MQTEFVNKILELQEPMIKFALQLTCNHDEAKDLSQETMLRVLNNREKFIEGTNLKAWVFTIMRNIFINDYNRRMRTMVSVNKTENLYHLSCTQVSNIDTIEGIYSVNEITKIVHTFPDDYRVPFTMLVTGYKYNEIAEYMKIPVGTVKSRIFIIRQKLQKVLKDYKN